MPLILPSPNAERDATSGIQAPSRIVGDQLWALTKSHMNCNKLLMGSTASTRQSSCPGSGQFSPGCMQGGAGRGDGAGLRPSPAAALACTALNMGDGTTPIATLTTVNFACSAAIM